MRKETNPGSSLIIYANHHFDLHKGKSQRNSVFAYRQRWNLVNIWKIFAISCLVKLTLEVSEVRRDKMLLVIIQDSKVEIKLVPMKLTLVDSKLVAFYCKNFPENSALKFSRLTKVNLSFLIFLNSSPL